MCTKYHVSPIIHSVLGRKPKETPMVHAKDVQDRPHPFKTQKIYLSLSPTYTFHIPLHITIYALENYELSLFFKVLHQTEKELWKNLYFLKWKSWAFTHSRSPLSCTIMQTTETTAGNTYLDFTESLVTLPIF